MNLETSIVEELSYNGAATAGELAERLNQSLANIRSVLTRMYDAGRVVMNGDRYVIPMEGAL